MNLVNIYLSFPAQLSLAMKIVQSFWSKPSFHTQQSYSNARPFGGWLNFRYFVLSSSYSCLTLRKHNKEIDLFTDSYGYNLFIDDLKLPYDYASKELDALENEDHRLWIRGKMMAIEAQQKPFIHVDNDVFVWDAFPDNPSHGYLIAQSVVAMANEYKKSLNEVHVNFNHIPDCLLEKPTSSSLAANVGIIGGNNIDFFREFCKVSSDLLEKNRNSLSKIDIGGFNQIMEEYLFYRLANHKGNKIDYYVDSSKDKVIYDSVLRLNLGKFYYKYIHLIGSYRKQNFYNCEQIELRLKYEFPEYYEKICEVLQSKFESPSPGTMPIRQNKVYNLLKILYNSSLEEIADRKIKLSEGAEIVQIFDHVQSKESQLAVKETDVDSGETIHRRLPYYIDFLKHFDDLFEEPVSVNEIVSHFEKIEGTDIAGFRIMMLDLVTKYLLFGLLEFAETN